MSVRRRRDNLARLQEAGVLRPLDVEIGRCLLALEPHADPRLGLAAAVASLAVAQGHSCLPLDHLHDVLAEAGAPAAASLEPTDTNALREALASSRHVAAAVPGATAPLLLDDRDRLYLGRYFHYERQVARGLIERLRRAPSGADRSTAQGDLFVTPTSSAAKALHDLLRPHFVLDDAEIDWQAVAVLTGLLSPLSVITGGPGTGKTTTVLWLLAALVAQRLASGQAPPRIRLAAPTGKAAARLSESLRGRIARLDVPDAVRTALPQEASTLHRLLGVRHGSTRFRHHAGHPLDADIVVVDEASMVDLPLMAKLLDALPARARLVLLGDRDQLASVEAGNVLAAICEAAGEGRVSPERADLVLEVMGVGLQASAAAPVFADAVVALKRSHRFGRDSGLGRLAAHIRSGEVQALLDGLDAGSFAGIHLDAAAARRPAAALVESLAGRFAALGRADDPAAALRESARLRVLTALRDGPSGSRVLNAAFEYALRQHAGVAAERPWYPGRLLLVTENDYGTELFNGDIGIVLAGPDGHLQAWFPATDGGVRSLPLQALPAHESAYAMTIHKSQGSEFDEVVIVLPVEDARVLGRELLYTAVTRARERVALVATDTALRRAVGRSTRRFSGLADMLGPALVS